MYFYHEILNESYIVGYWVEKRTPEFHRPGCDLANDD